MRTECLALTARSDDRVIFFKEKRGRVRVGLGVRVRVRVEVKRIQLTWWGSQSIALHHLLACLDSLTASWGWCIDVSGSTARRWTIVHCLPSLASWLSGNSHSLWAPHIPWASAGPRQNRHSQTGSAEILHKRYCSDFILRQRFRQWRLTLDTYDDCV